jgi:hypothetical protein
MPKSDMLRELSAKNPGADQEQAEEALRLIDGIRKLGIRRREYALTSPFRKFKSVPDNPRRRRMRATRVK